MLQSKQFENLDILISELKSAKDRWAQLPVKNKINLLSGVIDKTGQNAQQWVDLSLQNKQLQPNSPYAGEEWNSGPWALAYATTEYRKTLEHIQKNTLSKLVKKTCNRKNGQLKVKVFPNNFYEKLFFSKINGEIWMQKGVTKENLQDNMASFYKQKKPKGKVSLVLGAGNINAIAPLDMIYKLIVDGEVVLLKMNPVNDYLAPVMENIFKNFIENDFVRIIDGGAEVGQYLTNHPDIESIHITGSKESHNAIVYGLGEEGKKRRKNNDPILNPSKIITSELGNIGPTIVVPGPWTKSDIRHQAENIVTFKLHNNGYNCAASQLLIVPESWDHSNEIVDNVIHLMKTIPYREAYYPGSADRVKQVMQAYPNAEKLTEGNLRIFIPGINSNNEDEFAFKNEFFGAVYAQTTIEGNTTLEYLKNAVRFCNNKLSGTLGINLIIHPKTMRDLGDELENCIAELKYGIVSINVWNAAAFLLPQSSWGAYPGHTYDDIQSGIGTVRNSFMFDKPEKTVYFGPFRPLPRALNMAPPRPPWFVTNRTAHITMKRITKFAVKPRIWQLPGIIYSAMKG